MRLRFCVAAALGLSGCAGNDGIVRPDEPGKLVLEPSSIEAHAGQYLVVKASLPNGSALVDKITWTTTDPRVAFILGDSILPRAQGTATVTATAGDRSGAVKVTVLTDVALGGFQSPFNGAFPTGNVFDHDLPYYFKPEFNNGYLLSYWGEKFGQGADSHNGYDWIMPAGTPIYSTAPGRVTFAGAETPFNCPFLPNNPLVAGLWVVMAHAVFPNESVITQYGHLTSFNVKRGDQVPAGHLLGYSGSTGCSTTPHLHFTVFRMRGTESVVRAGSQTTQRVMDPYGWSGPSQDPWAADTGGIQSLVLWAKGKAPVLYGPGWVGPTSAAVAALSSAGLRFSATPLDYPSPVVSRPESRKP